MPLDSKGIKGKRWVGLTFAVNGIKEAIKTEKNIRIHLVVAGIVILSGGFIGLSLVEWGLLFLTIGLVISLEMINAAIERIMDYLAPDIHPAVEIIKDISAGAVLVSACISVVIGIIIFLPKILAFF